MFLFNRAIVLDRSSGKKLKSPDPKPYANHPMAGLRPVPQINPMRKHKRVVLVAASAAILSVVTPGCDRTISHTEKSSENSDGTVKSKETTVTEHPDGSVTK